MHAVRAMHKARQVTHGHEREEAAEHARRMAPGGTGRVISTSLLLTVLVAASAATTSMCAVVAATANAPVHQHQAAAGGASRGMSSASRFLGTAAGRCRACRRGYPAAGACPGRRLRCCGGLCTDVLASASHCGACGKRCAFGRLCCGGRCVAVAHDAENCGACGRACPRGLPCTYGMCGYA